MDAVTCQTRFIQHGLLFPTLSFAYHKTWLTCLFTVKAEVAHKWQTARIWYCMTVSGIYPLLYIQFGIYFLSSGIKNDVKSYWPASFLLSFKLVTTDSKGREFKHQINSSLHFTSLTFDIHSLSLNYICLPLQSVEDKRNYTGVISLVCIRSL